MLSPFPSSFSFLSFHSSSSSSFSYQTSFSSYLPCLDPLPKMIGQCDNKAHIQEDTVVYILADLYHLVYASNFKSVIYLLYNDEGSEFCLPVVTPDSTSQNID